MTNFVIQSGLVTPSHLVSWTTDGVVQDAGITFLNTYGMFATQLLSVNFNAANTDNVLPVNLPAGYTRYLINLVMLSGATASLSTATCGLFTATGGGGTAVIASNTAITVTSSGIDQNNNLMIFTVTNINTQAWSDTTLFFRVQTPQGNAAFGNVTLLYNPLP